MKGDSSKMVFNYKKDVNALNVNLTAMKIATCLTTCERSYITTVAKSVANALQQIHHFCYRGNKQICKEVKSSLIKDVSTYIKTRNIYLVKAPMMKEILRLNLEYTELINVAMSVARWPEFYLHSEAYLKQISMNLENHLNEINAITIYDETGKRICPYDPNKPHDDKDWYFTLKSQEQSVYEFLESSKENAELKIDWRKLISADRIKQAIEVLIAEIDGKVPNTDPFASGFINVVRYIRKHKEKVIKQMRQYISGDATAELFTLSESRSPISDLEPVMQILHKMGFKKSSAPMVLENLFHCQYPNLGIQPQEGQVIVDMLGECFTVAPGLGPGYKIRFVYNTHSDVQNSITPLANLLQRADRLLDDMEAYNDQMKLLLSDLCNIIDAYCTDSTGYSDYLHRCIYSLLLKIYGFPDDIIWYVLKVFSMPLLIKGKYYKVPFGSMQGCKLLVFLMNHANRLMGIIARKLSRAKTSARPNAGDDVTAYSRIRIYKQEEIAMELAVFSFFNCPVNNAKTAWLERDGYFDFCSKYYARIPESQCGVFSCTGLPPKCVGKQIISINGFAELFKVMDSAGTKHRSSEECFDILYPMMKADLQAGCILKNAYGKRMKLEDKVAAAKQVSYDLGGIASPNNIDIKSKLNILKFII